MSNRPKAELLRANEAISRADFSDALEILSALVAADPTNAAAWQQLGLCHLELRRPDLAIEALTKALTHGSHDSTTHLLLGHAYGSSGHLEPAAACYRRAIEADPSHAKAEEFLIKTESLLESREHYRNALKALYGPQPSRKDLNVAVRGLVQSIAIFDGSPARDNLRECARKILDRSRERPIDVGQGPELGLWLRACERGSICLRSKNWAGGRAAYQEALSYRSGDAFVHHALGFCFVEESEIEDGVRAWLRVVELDADYDFTCFGRPLAGQKG